ncbi:class I SAM-dependent methyltransferase [Phreatobacter stygius]|uniref:Class I SAM-dependent methyltransferase n=1 Tax=Phreatobacter stygius TaxID=1940610 RepID=A0A4D7BHY1_9HYPH|nr:class I SAM-dependent methyltransferase [Phreatobacter stygius]
MPDRDWWAALWPDPEATLRRLGVRPDMSVLDLCCGDGYFTAPLAKIVGGRIDALDLDPAMIERAKAEAARQGVSIRRWICADARDVAGLVAEPVDYVLMANTFHGVPDQPGLAQAVKAVLKPSGLFVVVNWHPQAREQTTVLGQPRGPKTAMRMSPETLGAVIEPVGFRAVRLVDLPPYHYGAVFERPA